MKFLPFEKITLETKLTEKEITDRFSGFIEPVDFLRLKVISNEEPEIPYEGTISNHRFKIQRITNNARTTTPVVIGEMENGFDKTLINLKIRLRISQIIGLCIWCGIVGFHLVRNALIDPFDIITLFLLGMLIYAYFFLMSMFDRESLRAKIDLQELLEARERNDTSSVETY